ncbi:hypothetical protein NE237_026257 [Protea cynaroides]|uniref:Uncharacterized protein n=1 Tax=Protea cynaroides TaxID=273540 RepID=A0A9Q0K102_9MAGN|nr:hypothetical protein NE237_026257 [Protea cynaroides]
MLVHHTQAQASQSQNLRPNCTSASYYLWENTSSWFHLLSLNPSADDEIGMRGCGATDVYFACALLFFCILFTFSSLIGTVGNLFTQTTLALKANISATNKKGRSNRAMASDLLLLPESRTTSKKEAGMGMKGNKTGSLTEEETFEWKWHFAFTIQNE